MPQRSKAHSHEQQIALFLSIRSDALLVLNGSHFKLRRHGVGITV